MAKKAHLKFCFIMKNHFNENYEMGLFPLSNPLPEKNILMTLSQFNYVNRLQFYYILILQRYKDFKRKKKVPFPYVTH